MIRDISEIQTLATKYSKPQLARMAQMGLIDPTKAVMAGMMIDRITKSNMQAPQQTVAQEALTPMPPQGAMAPQMSPAMQQPMPQAPVAPAGIGALPTQPEPNAGVSALPSGITNMAEGGIVAFAGEGPSLVGTPTINYDEQLRQIKLREQQAEAARLEAERKEKSKAQAFFTGFEALNPDQRQGMATTIRQKMQNNIPLTASEQGLVQNIPQFRSMVEAEMAKYPQQNTQVTAASQSQNVAPSPPPPPAAQNRRQRRTNANANTKQQTPVASDPTQQQVTTQQPAPVTEQPNVVQEEPMGIASIVPKRPETLEVPQNLGKFTITPIPVPGKKEIKDFLTEQDEAQKQAGVNTNIYKDLMGDLDEKKGKLAGRKQEAIGNALMQTGIALLGARKGQEFAVLSESGQKSLQGLVFANEKIRETEDKIDDARRGLLVAENDYKRTRSDKALESMQKYRDKIESFEIRNIEAQNEANKKTAEIQVQLFGKQVDLRGQEMQGYGYETQRASAAETERSRRKGALDVANVQKESHLAGIDKQSESHLAGIRLQGQNQLAVQRMQNLGLNRPGETERLMSRYYEIEKTQGKEAAEKWLQVQERISGRGKTSSTNLQEQYADDWNKMDIMQRRNMKDQGITTEQQYIDYRLKLAGRNPTAQPSATGSVDKNNPLLK
jgi:hypothetical protein